MTKKKITIIIITSLILLGLINLLARDESSIKKHSREAKANFTIYLNLRKINTDIYQALFAIEGFSRGKDMAVLSDNKKTYKKNIIQIKTRLKNIKEAGTHTLEFEKKIFEIENKMAEIFNKTAYEINEKMFILEKNKHFFEIFEDLVDKRADSLEIDILNSEKLGDLFYDKNIVGKLIILMVLTLILAYSAYTSNQEVSNEDFIYSIISKKDEKKLKKIIRLVGNRVGIDKTILKEIADYMFLYELNSNFFMDTKDFEDEITSLDIKKYHILYNLSYIKKYNFPQTSVNMGKFIYENWDGSDSVLNTSKNEVPKDVRFSKIIYFYS